jgi:hypothetical protein
MKKGNFIRLVALQSVDLGVIGAIKKHDYCDYKIVSTSDFHIAIKTSPHAQSIWILKNTISDNVINTVGYGILPKMQYQIIDIKNTRWRRFLFKFGFL